MYLCNEHGESTLTYVTVLQFVLLEFETNAEYIIPFPFCADHFLLKLNHRNNLSASHTRIQQMLEQFSLYHRAVGK